MSPCLVQLAETSSSAHLYAAILQLFHQLLVDVTLFEEVTVKFHSHFLLLEFILHFFVFFRAHSYQVVNRNSWVDRR